MRRYTGAVVLGLVCFALGAAVQRYYDSRQPARQAAGPTPAPPAAPPAVPATSTADVANIPFEREPLWAYGFDAAPKPGDKAQPQAPPSRNLRPNEDPVEQTKPRRVDGSSATYSLVDIRDGQNVIDWFPGDHPPDAQRRRARTGAHGQDGARVRLVSPAQWKGTS